MFLAHYAEKAGSGILDMISRCRQAATEPSSRESLQDALGMKDREHFRKTYLDPLVSAGWLERTIPDKPTSRLQKYRLTDKDRAWLAKKKSNGSAK